eukprot:scaffold186478_cov46-Prasinocladus_malaysianus.AAC.2
MALQITLPEAAGHATYDRLQEAMIHVEALLGLTSGNIQVLAPGVAGLLDAEIVSVALLKVNLVRPPTGTF